MKKPHRVQVLTWRSLLACLLLSLTAPFTAAQDNEEYQDLVMEGDAVCTRCHDETEYVPILNIGKTPHGTMADGRTPTCVSCHGESQAHLDDEEQPLDRQFGKDSTTPVAERNGVCLDCHQGGSKIHWQMSTHSANDMACTSCHEVHTQHDRVRERLTQADVCFACHKEQRMDMNKFSTHPTEQGQVVCSDCHNAHGSAGPKNMVRDTVVDTCYQCHAEKRGPFIWDHMPVTEDCSNCHNPHGSNIAAMLKVRMPMLCLECHTNTSHRGALPELGHRNTSGRGCLNCHTNIHGGNNATDSSRARSFMR